MAKKNDNGISLAAAMADTSLLGEFEGEIVSQSAIEIPKAGGGLHDSMRVAPQIWSKGDKVRLLLDVECSKIRFESIKGGETLRRVHIFVPEGAVVVPEGFGQKELDAQAERIRKAVEEASGIIRLPLDKNTQDHEGGFHSGGLVEGCERCQEEIDAAAEGD